MTDEYKYETIESERLLGILYLLFSWDFRSSKEIMTDLTEKIEEYEKPRGIKTTYCKEIHYDGREKTPKVKMKSKDGVVQGIITYEPMEPPSPLISASPFSRAARVVAKFNFNSNNEADKIEYMGLVKLIKNM